MFRKMGDILQNAQPVGQHQAESNQFADLAESPTIEASEQQQTVPQTVTPEPKTIKEKNQKVKEYVFNPTLHKDGLPPREGPSIWWEKDPNTLHAITRWHRKHPMSPDYNVLPERSEKTDRPPKPTTPTKSWYENE